MSPSLQHLTLVKGDQEGPMFRNKPPEGPPRPRQTIWTNLFGEAMGGVALAILGGVVWLVVSLPQQLGAIKYNQEAVLEKLENVTEIQEKHDVWLRDHERRLVREETLRQ